MCEWKSKYLSDYQCKEPSIPSDPKGYCILHSREEDKNIDAFRSVVKERLEGKFIDLIGCYFPRKFDEGYFRRYNFTTSVSFIEATFSQVVYFTEAKFFKEAYFTGTKFSQKADFYTAEFSQKADFYTAEFSEANFERATFSQEASFFGATFSQMVYFVLTKFFEEAYFTNATFSQDAYFIGATFTKEVRFNGNTFSQEADFTKTVFQGGRTDFRGTYFKGDVIFSDTQFKSAEVSFSDTEFIGEGEVDFDNPHFADCQVYFIKTHFEKPCKFRWVEFPRTHKQAVFEEANLSKCSFLHSNIDRVDFRYCTFNKKEGLFRKRQNVLRDELVADEEVTKNLEDKKPGTLSYSDPERSEGEESRPFAFAQGDRNKKLREEKYESVRRLYLELKRNFEDKKDWHTAGDFHYGEMECRRKGRLGGWLDFLLVTAYYGASGYGERPWRALLWWFFSTLLFFPLLYRLSEHDPLSACVWDSVRVATFMKIGIPIEPESWGRIVLTLQYFICPTLLALFALALRRKVKR